MLDFYEYQRRSKETAIYPGKDNIDGLMYCALGLASEAGEVAGKVKKLYRDGHSPDTDKAEQWYLDMEKELGDCLWYLSQIAEELGLQLQIAAETNIAKLQSRKDRGVLGGSGDNR